MNYRLYKKSGSKELDLSLFKEPTNEYRGTPFWSWNTKLNEKELLRQIDCLQEMGFGGFHIHARSGLDTAYLGDEFMRLVCSCNEKAKQNDMLFYMYDEDRYSSGAAGGYATKNYPVYRSRYLVFSLEKKENATDKKQAVEQGKCYLIAQYDVKLDKDGKLLYYCKTEKENAEEGCFRLYAYCGCAACCGWNNGGAELDTMSRDAVNFFLDITLGAYKNAVGGDFGENIPSIFTDEPHVAVVERLLSPIGENFLNRFPWTKDFQETFVRTYGFDIVDFLPEILYDLAGDKPSYARYAFYDHTSERFTEAFGDTYAKRCEELGIQMTGHVLSEDDLLSQTLAVGECMRFYRNMQLPGIDTLCDWRLYTTAKQAQSVVHQNGREGMLSELYGVTGWNCDFRTYKAQGDWQAAMGVTIRVPHLTWVSMRGTAKRDYPASIGPHSPWYKEYNIIEDHFARLNTVLTRGKPVIKVGVIHPVESMWTVYGPKKDNNAKTDMLDNAFIKVTLDLLKNHYDFNYICESLLPGQVGEITDELTVGCMKYSAVIVPVCFTLRETTVEILEKYVENGGKLLFIGDKPIMTDGKLSNRIDSLYNSSEHADINNFTESKTLSHARTIEIKDENGKPADNLIYCMRQDGEDKWVFITHIESDYKKGKRELLHRKIEIITEGEFQPKLYNTASGEIENIDFSAENGKTKVYAELYDNDTLLIRFGKKAASYFKGKKKEFVAKAAVCIPQLAECIREEENVLLLDKAEYRVDEGEWQQKQLIVPLNAGLRVESGYEESMGNATQPWTLPDTVEKVITLRFEVDSAEQTPVSLCYESGFDATLNGAPLDITAQGSYVDFDIKKSKKFMLERGRNIITVKVPFSKKFGIENMYIVGEFNVELLGAYARIVPLDRHIGFSSIVHQGMPFYGGSVIYKSEIKTPAGDMKITCRDYAGALVRIYLDGRDSGTIIYSPYSLIIKNVEAGNHTLEIKVYGNRENTFGRVHNRYPSIWYGRGEWYPKDDALSEEYCLVDIGLTHAPKIEMGTETLR